MDIIKQIKEIINEAETSSILRERLILLQEHVKLLAQENATLKEENAKLMRDGNNLQKQQEAKFISEQFVERSGVLFMKVGQGYSNVAYCPVCKIPLSALTKSFPLDCAKCGFVTHIRPCDIPAIIANL